MRGYFSHTLTYNNTLSIINRTYLQLSSLLKPKTKDFYVGLKMANSPYFIIAFWAVIAIGAKPILLNNQSTKITSSVHRLVGLDYLISDNDDVDNEIETINITRLIDLSNIEPLLDIKYPTFGDAFGFTSSMTSGDLKICIYNGRSIINEVNNASYITKHNRYILSTYHHEIRVLAFLPLFHIFGLVASYFWFSTFGASLSFIANNSASTIFNTIRRDHITHLFGVPLLFSSFEKEILKDVRSRNLELKFSRASRFCYNIQRLFPHLGNLIAKKINKAIYTSTFGPSIKFLISGGSMIKESTLKFMASLGLRLFNGYGSSETGISALVVKRNIKARSTINTYALKALPSVTYDTNEDSELLIKSNFSASKIISSKEEMTLDANTFYNTHDLVTLSANKRSILIKGRLDDVVVLASSEKLSLIQIEELLNFKTIDPYVIFNYNQHLMILIEKSIVNINNYDEIKKELDKIPTLNLGIVEIYFVENLKHSDELKISSHRLIQNLKSNSLKLYSLSDIVSNFRVNEDDENEISIYIKKLLSNYTSIALGDIKSTSNLFYELGLSSLDYYNLITDVFNHYVIKYNYSKVFNTILELVNFIKEYVNEALPRIK
jgi:long-subunit acyl-CoA synthetase (AMP-forming)/acyl carrier protein